MNVNSIKQKIKQAIAKMPTTVALYRQAKVADGIGGYTLGTATLIKTFNGLLDNSSHGFISGTTSEGGMVVKQKSYTLLIVYDETFAPMAGDYFTVNGLKYIINNPVNILNLNIYWECNLEVNNNG